MAYRERAATSRWSAVKAGWETGDLLYPNLLFCLPKARTFPKAGDAPDPKWVCLVSKAFVPANQPTFTQLNLYEYYIANAIFFSCWLTSERAGCIGLKNGFLSGQIHPEYFSSASAYSTLWLPYARFWLCEQNFWG